MNHQADRRNRTMKTSSKISNLRRDLVNTYGLPAHIQFEFIDIYNEVVKLEGRPELQLQIPESERPSGQLDEPLKQAYP